MIIMIKVLFTLLSAVFLVCCPQTGGGVELQAQGVKPYGKTELTTFVNQDGRFTKKPDIYFIFIDTLRKDFVNPELTPNIAKMQDDSLRFSDSYSSSTVTHSSTFGMFYSQPAIYRNHVLLQGWDKGSPFLNLLKKNGYKLY